MGIELKLKKAAAPKAQPPKALRSLVVWLWAHRFFADLKHYVSPAVTLVRSKPVAIFQVPIEEKGLKRKERSCCCCLAFSGSFADIADVS